jgi:hypothetical protein
MIKHMRRKDNAVVAGRPLTIPEAASVDNCLNKHRWLAASFLHLPQK